MLGDRGLGYCFQKGGQIVWLHFAFYNFRLWLMILEVEKTKFEKTRKIWLLVASQDKLF